MLHGRLAGPLTILMLPVINLLHMVNVLLAAKKRLAVKFPVIRLLIRVPALVLTMGRFGIATSMTVALLRLPGLMAI